MQETLVQSLGWEDPLEEETATHTSILARKIPWTRGAWHAGVHGFAESDMIEHAKAGDMGLILAPRRVYMLWGNQACKPQLLKPTCSRAQALQRKKPPNGQPMHRKKSIEPKRSLCSLQLEKAHVQQ